MFLNIMNLQIGFGILYIAFLAYLFPGGDMVLATVIIVLLTVPQALVYAMLSAAMPRAGGDYVFVSRTLHPAIGFVEGWGMALWFCFWLGVQENWVLTFMLSPILATIGAVTGNATVSNMAATASNPNVIAVVATVLLIIGAVISARSTKFTLRIIGACVTLGLLAVVVVMLVFATTGPGVLMARFNAFSLPITNNPDYYHAIISSARSAGFNPNPGFNWSDTAAIMPLSSWIFTYIAMQQVVGGEIKDAKKNSMLGLFGALAVTGLLVVATLWFFEQSATMTFINAISYLFSVGSSAYVLPMPPYYHVLASIVLGNSPLLWLIAIGFAAYLFSTNPADYLIISRYFLAMSFDRVLPSALARVSERWNTPTLAIAVTFVGGEIAMLLYTYVGGILTSLSAILGTVVTSYLLVAICGIAFPYVRKDLFENSPYKQKIAGVPVLVLAGVITTMYLLFLTYYFVVFGQYGVNNVPSLAVVFGIIVSGVIVYYVARRYCKAKGLDIGLAFKEIPPE
jgi:amino acid transporter